MARRCNCGEFTGPNLIQMQCREHDEKRAQYMWIPTEFTALCSAAKGAWNGICFDCHMRRFHRREWCEGIGYGQTIDSLILSTEELENRLSEIMSARAKDPVERQALPQK